MGLADFLGSEDRVEVKYSDFYTMVKESTKIEIVEDAYDRGHDPKDILNIMFESKSVESYQYIGDDDDKNHGIVEE